MSKLSAAISSYVKKKLPSSVRMVRELCGFRSITGERENARKCAVFVEELMNDFGVKTEIIKPPGGNPIILGELKSKNPKSKRRLLFYNHYDTTPVEPLKNWTCDPFNGSVKDGSIFARGAADNKGHLAARLAAVEAVQHCLGDIPIDLGFVVEGDEELGSPYLKDVLAKKRKFARGDGAIWEMGLIEPDGRPRIHLGMRGMLSLELSYSRLGPEVHSSWAQLTKSPSLHLVSAIASMVKPNGQVTVDGFYDHVLKPTDYEMKLLAIAKFDTNDYARKLGLGNHAGLGRGAKALSELTFQPGSNLTSIESGNRNRSVVPTAANARLDFRLIPNQEPQSIVVAVRQHLKRHGFRDVTVNVRASTRPAKTSPQTRIVTVTRQAAKQVYRAEPALWPILNASGPMNVFTEFLHIPTVGTGMADVNSRLHGPNENIKISNLAKGIQHTALIIATF